MKIFFVDIRQELFLCTRLSLTARLTHFEGQTSLKASIPLISTIFVCYRKPFFGDPDSDVKNANFFVYVRQDLIYAYGFPSRPVRPILKVKRPLKLAYPSFRRFSCAIANHFWVIWIPKSKMPYFFCGRSSRTCQCIQFASWTVRPISNVQRAPKRAYIFILTIFVCYRKPFFG